MGSLRKGVHVYNAAGFATLKATAAVAIAIAAAVATAITLTLLCDMRAVTVIYTTAISCLYWCCWQFVTSTRTAISMCCFEYSSTACFSKQSA
jgi:hypothetical protein